MKTLLVSLPDEVATAVGRASTEVARGIVNTADAAAALRLLNEDDSPAVVLVGGGSIEEIVASCRQLCTKGRHFAVVAAVRGDEQDVRAVLDAGADDFFIESLGESVLRSRLLVARRNASAGEAQRLAMIDHDKFFELSLDLLCLAGLDGYFKKLNAAWTTSLGWSEGELKSKPWLGFVHPDDRDATIAAGQRLETGQAITSFSNRYLSKSGTYRWLEWQSTPDTSQGTIYAVARDVTQERAAKKALSELSESLATTLQSIGDAVIATDVAGAVVRMNRVAERLTGWSADEARSRPLSEVLNLVQEDTGNAVESPIQRALTAGAVAALPSDSILVRRDGSKIPIAESCAPIRTTQGTVNGAVLVFRDLTAEREAAAVEAKYRQQLVFSDRMASVGTLAAGVAHEMNNPLTYVTANLDLAIEEIRSIAGASSSGRIKELEEMLIEAREGAARVTKIVRGLKTFSRIEEERRSVIDLVPVLELSINMAYNEIRHRARLVKHYGKLPLVDADDARLGQVFVNLLINAAQAMPDGNSDANEIRVVTSTDAAGSATVEIHDTGPGIPEPVLARIFDPFFTTKPVGVGTGLGLAICHNIVTGMGGKISVQSKLGSGTTFRVELPASGRELPLAASEAMLREVTPSTRAKVLVIDDEPAVGIAVGRVLSEHEVTVVTSAEEALALLTNGKEFHVILSDLMMPAMSGMEFYDVLAREQPKMAGRMAFITGGAFTPEANAFLDRVANERIEKPFDFRQLRDLVKKFVK